MLSEPRAGSAPVTVGVRLLGLPQAHSTARSPGALATVVPSLEGRRLTTPPLTPRGQGYLGTGTLPVQVFYLIFDMSVSYHWDMPSADGWWALRGQSEDRD